MTQPKTESTREQVLAKHEKFILGAVANYYADPIVLESGQGRNVTDTEGRTYLDFFGGILTVSVGHCDERVTGPMKTQMDRLGHVSTLYPTLPIVELAERLARITPGRLQKSMFTASGTEADETAVALAQVYTGSIELIALRHGYSGRSLLAQSLTGQAPWRAVPSQVAGIKHAHAPYCYRCPLKLEYPSCGVACATDIEEYLYGSVFIFDDTPNPIISKMMSLITGHENTGDVIEPPRTPQPISEGDCVALTGVLVCEECCWCRSGEITNART